jgi:hypothetical protein
MHELSDGLMGCTCGVTYTLDEWRMLMCPGSESKGRSTFGDARACAKCGSLVGPLEPVPSEPELPFTD